MSLLSRIAWSSVPLMTAAALVVTEFAAGNAGHWTTLVRPIGLAVLGALVFEAIALGVIRRVREAVMLTTAVVLVLLGGDLVMIFTASVLAACLAFAGLQRLRGRPMPRLHHPVVVPIAAVTLLISTAQLVTSGAVVVPDALAEPGTEAAAGPNMYVMVLDAYARADTLAGLGFDNQPFLSDLEGLGFDVYDDSRSNYTYTATALATMLHMKPLTELEGMPPAGSSWQAQSGALLSAINDAEATSILRDRGYRTIGIPPVANHSALVAVDEVRDSGTLTDFERHVLTDTALAGILEVVAPDWIAGQYRQRTLHAFSAVTPEPAATFVWMHVLMPHAPYVFDADGEPIPLPACIPGCPWGASMIGVPDSSVSVYLDQVEFTNQLVLAAVSGVITADPDAVIVVMGDHGARLDESDRDEWFRNLLVVRSPGHPRLLGEAPTTVNILPAILDAYVGTDLPRWPDDHFWGTGTEMTRIGPVH